jgi:hypothetical protein
LAGAPISSEKFWAYSSSNSDQGMRLAMITRRLSGDNFPCEGQTRSFLVRLGVARLCGTLVLAKEGARVLSDYSADFLAPERLSIQLKAFSDQGYSFFQPALK